jgi:molybdenum cofactor cytidylyltransferase
LAGEFNLGVAILAAGLSTRMGQPKLLLPWQDTSVLGHSLRTWTTLGAAQIAVVCQPDAAGVNAELERLSFARQDRIANPKPQAGMLGSIQCAARWPNWRAGLTHFAIVLGDQPHLRLKTLGQLLDFAAGRPRKICQPLRNGRRRHPVILPRAAFARLAGFSGTDLSEFLNSSPKSRAGCEVDDRGLDLDLDSPTDYERLIALADRPAARG